MASMMSTRLTAAPARISSSAPIAPCARPARMVSLRALEKESNQAKNAVTNAADAIKDGLGKAAEKASEVAGRKPVVEEDCEAAATRTEQALKSGVAKMDDRARQPKNPQFGKSETPGKRALDGAQFAIIAMATAALLGGADMSQAAQPPVVNEAIQDIGRTATSSIKAGLNAPNTVTASKQSPKDVAAAAALSAITPNAAGTSAPGKPDATARAGQKAVAKAKDAGGRAFTALRDVLPEKPQLLGQTADLGSELARTFNSPGLKVDSDVNKASSAVKGAAADAKSATGGLFGFGKSAGNDIQGQAQKAINNPVGKVKADTNKALGGSGPFGAAASDAKAAANNVFGQAQRLANDPAGKVESDAKNAFGFAKSVGNDVQGQAQKLANNPAGKIQSDVNKAAGAVNSAAGDAKSAGSNVFGFAKSTGSDVQGQVDKLANNPAGKVQADTDKALGSLGSLADQAKQAVQNAF